MAMPASAQNFEPDELINISVYEKINPAIVSIDANLDDGFSAGTGCVVRNDGIILTGSHVIEGAKISKLQLMTVKFIRQQCWLKWVKIKT